MIRGLLRILSVVTEITARWLRWAWIWTWSKREGDTWGDDLTNWNAVNEAKNTALTPRDPALPSQKLKHRWTNWCSSELKECSFQKIRRWQVSGQSKCHKTRLSKRAREDHALLNEITTACGSQKGCLLEMKNIHTNSDDGASSEKSFSSSVSLSEFSWKSCLIQTPIRLKREQSFRGLSTSVSSLKSCTIKFKIQQGD